MQDSAQTQPVPLHMLEVLSLETSQSLIFAPPTSTHTHTNTRASAHTHTHVSASKSLSEKSKAWPKCHLFHEALWDLPSHQCSSLAPKAHSTFFALIFWDSCFTTVVNVLYPTATQPSLPTCKLLACKSHVLFISDSSLCPPQSLAQM